MIFSQERVTKTLNRLDEAAKTSSLWLDGRWESSQLDIFSAVESAAADLVAQGHGPGGDPVWIGALIDSGWPEWLVMLMVSISYARSPLEEGATERVREILPEFSGSSQAASTYLFARSCFQKLSEAPSSEEVRARFVAHRLNGGEFSAVACLEALIEYVPEAAAELAPVLDEVRGLAEKLRAGIDLDAEEEDGRPFFRYWRFFGGYLDRQQPSWLELRGHDEVVRLIDTVRSSMRIDDYAPLNFLRWPEKSEAAPWAPTSAELIGACRASLVEVMSKSDLPPT